MIPVPIVGALLGLVIGWALCTRSGRLFLLLLVVLWLAGR